MIKLWVGGVINLNIFELLENFGKNKKKNKKIGKNY